MSPVVVDAVKLVDSTSRSAVAPIPVEAVSVTAVPVMSVVASGFADASLIEPVVATSATVVAASTSPTSRSPSIFALLEQGGVDEDGADSGEQHQSRQDEALHAAMVARIGTFTDCGGLIGTRAFERS